MVFFKNGLGFSLLLRCGSFCVGGSAFCWLHSFPRVSSLFLTTCWAHSKCILSPATTVALLSWQLVAALCLQLTFEPFFMDILVWLALDFGSKVFFFHLGVLFVFVVAIIFLYLLYVYLVCVCGFRFSSWTSLPTGLS